MITDRLVSVGKVQPKTWKFVICIYLANLFHKHINITVTTHLPAMPCWKFGIEMMAAKWPLFRLLHFLHQNGHHDLAVCLVCLPNKQESVGTILIRYVIQSTLGTCKSAICFFSLNILCKVKPFENASKCTTTYHLHWPHQNLHTLPKMYNHLSFTLTSSKPLYPPQNVQPLIIYIDFIKTVIPSPKCTTTYHLHWHHQNCHTLPKIYNHLSFTLTSSKPSYPPQIAISQYSQRHVLFYWIQHSSLH